MVTAVHPVPEATLTKEEELGVDTARRWRRSRFGLPGDSGNSAADSRLRPRGLARWRRCLDCREGSRVERWRRDSFSLDQILDNITAYWVTGTATSSLRIYWEMRQLVGRPFPRTGSPYQQRSRCFRARSVTHPGLGHRPVQRCALDNACSGWSLRRMGSAG